MYFYPVVLDVTSTSQFPYMKFISPRDSSVLRLINPWIKFKSESGRFMKPKAL